MDEFRLDPHLHDSIKGIRESVRRLFEQLRLKTEDGDISGKDRLERVPALAKRNFANLTSPAPHLAIKEAWRLIDFLEGNGDGRLSPRAREGLRLVELDKKMADCRASDLWRDTASRLRSQLGVDTGSPPASEIDLPPPGDKPDASPPDAPPGSGAGGIETEPRGLPNKAPWLLLGVLGSSAGVIALMFVAASWWSTKATENPSACLPLEDASGEALARHRAIPVAPPLPRPRRTEAAPRIFIISDPPGGGPVRSIWTTSQFSFAERTGPQRPGGGKSDLRLRVGGWGDTYLSLLRIPVPSDRLAHKAVVQLTVLGDVPGARPTSMALRSIGDDWPVSPGGNNRLWWKDCPGSEAVANHLPPPGPRGSVYEIDITDLYNFWAGGLRQPYGIMLEPENIGSWGPGRPHYPNFTTFYSTRARDPANRPRLVLTY